MGSLYTTPPVDARFQPLAADEPYPYRLPHKGTALDLLRRNPTEAGSYLRSFRFTRNNFSYPRTHKNIEGVVVTQRWGTW